MYFLQQGDIVLNLCLMSYIWSAYSFCYYLLIMEIKYFPGDIFYNNLSRSLSELAGCALAGVLLAKTNIRITSTFFFTIALIGGFLILNVGEEHMDWLPCFVLFSSFGTSAISIVAYTATL
jgi:hypothetical protein